MIHDVQDDPVLQVLVRNHQRPPSMDIKDRGFLAHFQSCYRAEIWHTSEESYIMMIHDVMDDPILHVPGQEPSTSSKYSHQGQGVLGTLLIMLEK